MAAVHNYTWDQGEDLELSMTYKEGPVGAPVAIDLTAYVLRMDIRKDMIDGALKWTFNSADLPGEPLVDETGPEDNEATLGPDGSINILVPRSLTLPGGALYDDIMAGATSFVYDVFLRSPQNRQKKILSGVVTVNKSVTLWV